MSTWRIWFNTKVRLSKQEEKHYPHNLETRKKENKNPGPCCTELSLGPTVDQKYVLFMRTGTKYVKTNTTERDTGSVPCSPAGGP